jgi:hypothetical protein
MLKMNTPKYIWLLILIHLSLANFAQNSNSMSITNRSTSSYDLSAIYTPGKRLEKIVDNSQWMNYSLKVNPSEPLQSISVSIATGTIPPGVEIYLEADSENGSGSGKMGKPTGKIRLSNVPQTLIHEIGTCNTGNGKYRGHRLTMTAIVTNFGLLEPGNYNLYILYTLNQ